MAGDNINEFLAGHTGNQRKAGAEDPQEGIEDHRALVALAVAEDPAPVIQDLAEGPIPPALPQRMERIEKRPFFVFRLLHSDTSMTVPLQL